jgi:hypothetical protein
MEFRILGPLEAFDGDRPLRLARTNHSEAAEEARSAGP